VTPSPALPRLALIDRSQLILRTVDVEKLIDEDHSARSIWELDGDPATAYLLPTILQWAHHHDTQVAE
jgi:hypothetical protein